MSQPIETAVSEGVATEGLATASPAAPPAKFPRYAIGLLFVIYALSFLDRQIVNILAEPIKRDLGLADWQMGATTGFAFALLYTTMGVPVARLADRFNRSRIIAVALLIWSGFTALCGLSASFVQLLLFRIGVGLGEAGCSPPAQSLIADITTKATRARAFAIYAMGVPIGSLLGMVVGGFAVEAWGWRGAFFLVGLPGVIVALLAFATLKDPRSKHSAEMVAKARAETPPLGAAIREMLSKPSFWWTSMGTALTAFVGYGQQAFLASFFIRNHADQIDALAASFGMGRMAFLGVTLGLMYGIAGSTGSYLGGALTDRYAARTAKVYSVVPAIGTFAACPLYIAALLLPSATWALLLLLLPTVFKNMYFGPVFTSIQGVVNERSRATATAVFLMVLNIFGLGLGPISIGALSDILSTSMGEAEGLRWAMIILTAMSILSGLCFWRAGKTLGKDLVA